MAAQDPAQPLTARFDGTAYAGATAHHRAFDADVLAPLHLTPGTDVLDLGCGVGDLTASVADRVGAGRDGAGRDGGGRVLGVDASPSCVRLAHRHHARAGVAFVAALAQDVGRLLRPSTFDVVRSVAALHWVPGRDQVGVLAGLAAALRPDGLLRVDMGGSGQVALVRDALSGHARDVGAPECPWFFPTADEYAQMLSSSGFDVRESRLVTQRRDMPDVAALERWLRSQVLPAWTAHVAPAEREAWSSGAVRRVAAVARRADGSYDQDFVRVRATARRRA